MIDDFNIPIFILKSSQQILLNFYFLIFNNHQTRVHHHQLSIFKSIHFPINILFFIQPLRILLACN